MCVDDSQTVSQDGLMLISRIVAPETDSRKVSARTLGEASVSCVHLFVAPGRINQLNYRPKNYRPKCAY